MAETDPEIALRREARAARAAAEALRAPLHGVLAVVGAAERLAALDAVPPLAGFSPFGALIAPGAPPGGAPPSASKAPRSRGRTPEAESAFARASGSATEARSRAREPESDLARLWRRTATPATAVSETAARVLAHGVAPPADGGATALTALAEAVLAAARTATGVGPESAAPRPMEHLAQLVKSAEAAMGVAAPRRARRAAGGPDDVATEPRGLGDVARDLLKAQERMPLAEAFEAGIARTGTGTRGGGSGPQAAGAKSSSSTTPAAPGPPGLAALLEPADAVLEALVEVAEIGADLLPGADDGPAPAKPRKPAYRGPRPVAGAPAPAATTGAGLSARPAELDPVDLAELVNDALVDQARRHGLDLS